MDGKKRVYWLGALLLCTSILVVATTAAPVETTKLKALAPSPDLAAAMLSAEAVGAPQPKEQPNHGAALDLATVQDIAKYDAAVKAGLEDAPPTRGCNDCLTPNTDLGDIGTVAWYTVSGDCATEGKWYASFNGYAGTTYYFDTCDDGSASSDLDVKVCDSTCAILAGVDGNYACNYNPDDFEWTCTADGTYYVVLAPYNSYSSHTCGGDATDTFTLAYYSAGDPCDGVTPPVNDDCTYPTPATLTSGVPQTFYGDNTCATWDGTCFGPYGDVWEAFTLSGSATGWDVTLDYCNSSQVFGNAWLNCALDCPCTAVTVAATFDTTTCADGNVTMVWSELADGTYYYPVMYAPDYNSVGAYTVTVVAVEHIPTYCEPCFSNQTDEQINNVTFNTINNTTGMEAPPCSYGDYTGLSTDIQRGSTYTAYVTFDSGTYTECVQVWIDWNQDLDFDDAGEYYSLGSGSSTTLSGDITVPLAAPLGATRMRVMVDYSTCALVCEATSYGEAEDYTVNVILAPPEGACCHQDGSYLCEAPVTQAYCEGLVPPGVYQGDGSDCDPDPCVGACCFADGSCDDTGDEAYCTGLGGTYQGDGTDCDPNPCPQPCVCATTITTFPYSESFEVDFGAWTQSIDDDMNWTRQSGPTTSSATGPTAAYDGTWYVYTETSGFNNMTAILDGPCFDLTAVPTPAFRFAYHMYGATMGELNFEVSDDYCLSWNTEWTLSGDQGDAWYIAQVDLSAYTGIIQVRFRGETGTSYTSDMAVDAIWVGEGGVVTGACCVGATCTVETEDYCLNTLLGTYIGDFTDCDPSPCVGACCDGSTCTLELAADCVSPRVYYGDGTTCDPNPCPQPGDNCEDPFAVTLGLLDLPYTDTNSTCGRDEYYENTCLGYYDGGDDMIYEFTITDDMNVTITLDPGTFTYSGFAIDTNCPPADPCLAYSTNSGSGAHSIGVSPDCLFLTAGTYYIMVDSWPSPQCIDFDLTIEECVVPTGACCDAAFALYCDELTAADCAAAGGSYLGNDTVCSGLDCNINGIDDDCDLDSGASLDCNGNGIPDECDIANLTSDDYDLNGVPDECDPDCNENGIPDACDIDCATGNCASHPIGCGGSEDCQPDGIPDDCQLGGAKGECTDMVYDNGICDGADGTRPTVGWNDTGIAVDFTVPQGDNGLTFSCFHMEILDFAQSDMPQMRLRIYSLPTNSIPTDLPSFAAATPLFDYTYTVASGELVIAVRPECYPGAGAWDYDGSGPSYTFAPGSYAALVNFPGSGAVNYWASAATTGDLIYIWGVQADAPSVGGMDVAFNLMGSASGADCNDNGIPDDCDIAECDTSGHPEWCDCDGNGVPDSCDLDADPSKDCNGNGRLDECDVPPICFVGPPACSLDCNSNLIPDECDLALGTSLDCNINGIPDECDIADCTPGDPDCADCNGNGIPDWCDIDSGFSEDCQPDGIPDECQLEAGAKAVVIDESFEGAFPPTGWTQEAFGTDAWIVTDNPDFAHTGTWGLYHTWGAPGFSEDSYLMTPELTLTTATLSLWSQGCGAGTQTWCDNYDVDVMIIVGDPDTDPGNPGSDDVFVANLNDMWIDYFTTWVELDVDLTPFLPGGPFRVGFRYYGGDGDAGSFDDVVIEGETGPVAPPENDCNENGVPDECDYCGDLNGDGNVDLDDYDVIRVAMGRSEGHEDFSYCADYDGDGLIEGTDYQAWLVCYFEVHPEAQSNKTQQFIDPQPNVGGRRTSGGGAATRP
ncbi:MAG: GEVED domain-containing protein [Planctomycetota bacterium]